MSRRFVSVFAGGILLTFVLGAGAGPGDDRGAVLRGLASQVGRALGAASACPSVARPRIDAIAAKIDSVIKSSAANQDEFNAIVEQLNKAESEGARSVAEKQTDCSSAERQIADLEQASAHQSGAIQPAAVPVQQAAAAVRGLSDNEIRFGASVPLTGPNKDYGQQIWQASKLHFAWPTMPAE